MSWPGTGFPDSGLCKRAEGCARCCRYPGKAHLGSKGREKHKITSASHQHAWRAHCRTASILRFTSPGSKNAQLLIRIFFFVLNPSLPPSPLISTTSVTYNILLSHSEHGFTTRQNLLWAKHPNSFLKSFLPQIVTGCLQSPSFGMDSAPVTIKLPLLVGQSVTTPLSSISLQPTPTFEHSTELRRTEQDDGSHHSRFSPMSTSFQLWDTGQVPCSLCALVSLSVKWGAINSSSPGRMVGLQKSLCAKCPLCLVHKKPFSSGSLHSKANITLLLIITLDLQITLLRSLHSCFWSLPSEQQRGVMLLSDI